LNVRALVHAALLAILLWSVILVFIELGM